MIKPGSQNARVLEVLADGLGHSAAEIHARAGFMRLNSRVAELRSKHGFDISCVQTGPAGPEHFVYQLHTPLEQPPAPTVAPAGGESDLRAEVPPGCDRVPAVGQPGGCSSGEQLSLLGEAA